MREGAGTGGRAAKVPTPAGRVVLRFKETARRFLEALERRRAEALRRRPGPLVDAFGRARSVLILCQGNVIRSVFAAQLLSTAVKDRTRVSIASAGLTTQPGWRAHPRVVARCLALRIDLGGHASVAATESMVRAADVVLVMDVSQLATVTRRFFGARRKTFLLTSLAPDLPMEIPDPSGKDDATVDACLDQVARAVKPMMELLSRRDGAAA